MKTIQSLLNSKTPSCANWSRTLISSFKSSLERWKHVPGSCWLLFHAAQGQLALSNWLWLEEASLLLQNCLQWSQAWCEDGIRASDECFGLAASSSLTQKFPTSLHWAQERFLSVIQRVIVWLNPPWEELDPYLSVISLDNGNVCCLNRAQVVISLFFIWRRKPK